MKHWATEYLKCAFVIPASTAFAAGPGIMAHEVGRISAGNNSKERMELLTQDWSPELVASTAGAVLAPIAGTIGGYELATHLSDSPAAGLVGGTLGGVAGLGGSNLLGRWQGRRSLEG